MESVAKTDGGISAGVPAEVPTDAPIPDDAPSSYARPDATETSEVPPEQLEASKQYRSKVNGLGMWGAWERNFSNKLKACLDLVDNAVDAALWDSDDEEDEEEGIDGRPLTVQERWKKQTGSIHISTEKHRLAMEDYDSDDDDEIDGDGDGETGNPKNTRGNDVEAKTQPFIVHDVFGPLGGRAKSGNGAYPEAGEKTSNFRLIDDENTLCLHNDCVKPVKELRKILDVYNSDKTDSAIGENGVGVKQAAAAMSDLSIVVTTRVDEEPLLMDYGDFEIGEKSVQRKRKVLISFGVLAKKMQTMDACMIPSWTMPIEFDIDEVHKKKPVEEKNEDGTVKDGNNDDDGMNEGGLDEDFIGNSCKPVLMRALFQIISNNRLLGKTMKEFGGAAEKNRRKYGIQRLAKHIELMVTSSKSKSKKLKPPHPHQYLMILHKFGKHKKNAPNGTNNDIAAIAKARNDLDDLLQDLADEMPRTYLHIPPAPYFKFRVNRKILKFQYWERNLVELHQIPLFVDRRNDFRTADDWMIPENEDDFYEIKVSIGFDPARANPKGSGNRTNDIRNTFIGGQACSLLIFSRISGRLFLKHDDARGVLRLTNSGTNYCQGLTIIVDDYEGHLPLTPTKESLAFGMEDYGKVHERNLYAWLGALANVYWNRFFNIFKTKKALGDAIKEKIESIKQLERKKAIELPTFGFGTFSTVENLIFSRKAVSDSIRPYKSDSTKWINGPSTLISLSDPKAKKKPKASTSVAKKRKAADFSALDGYDSDGNDLMDGAPPPSAFGNSAEQVPVQEDSVVLPERLDGRPRRATREPQRFEELPEPLKSRRKKFRYTKYEKGGDVHLKKKLREIESVLIDTQMELNASKNTCDDLQMQLEEAEAKHEEELQKVKEDCIKQLEASRARVLELEGKLS